MKHNIYLISQFIINSNCNIYESEQEYILFFSNKKL